MIRKSGMPSTVAHVSSTISHLVRGLSILFNQTRHRRPISFPRPCNKQREDGMMPPSCCRLLSRTRSLAADVLEERIDAETSDHFATGED